MKYAGLCSLVLCVTVLLAGCGHSSVGPSSSENAEEVVGRVASPTRSPLPTASSSGLTASPDTRTAPSASSFPPSAIESRGTGRPIPEEIRREMAGVSMPEEAAVTYEDFSYLTIPHYDFHGEIVQGHLIVDKNLADEVLDIFQELFQMKFPIERMEIIDRFQPYIDDTFDNLDRASMGQNNTSAFCYRVVNGTNRLSFHARGRAIDLNPKTNPYCIPASGYVSPANAYVYADRTQNHPGLIRHGDAVYQTFISRGWEWGGDWEGEKDYQHFQKP